MILIRTALLAATVCLAAPAVHAENSAGVDGLWSIEAIPTTALCPIKSHRMSALVRGGSVSKFMGLPDSSETSGRVDSDGGVAMSLKVLGYTAHAGGTVLGPWGDGTWSSDNSLCGQGKWHAHREK